jgi:glycerophosphoryl diester phosphodiesterase
VIVVAHRTMPLDHPENSLAGIAGAAMAGADVVEVDVRLTRDGVPVLMHDAIPFRTTRTILPVRWRSAASFDRLRVRGDDSHPPRFSAAVDALPDGLKMAIDVKDGRSMAATIHVLDRSGRLDDTLLWSEHPDAVRVAAERAPGVQRAWLKNTTTPVAAIQYCRDAAELGADAVSVMDVSLTSEVVTAGHDLGLVVYSWVRTLDAQATVIAAGPDGIVTDWVRQAAQPPGGAARG